MTHNPTDDLENTIDESHSIDEVMAAEGSAETATPQIETRDEEMARLRGEVADANNRVLMAQADLENFRKRMRRDVEDQIRFAAIPIVNDLLQVRDNLVRAVEAAAAGEAANNDGLRDGVKMLVKQFDDTLAKHAITAIASVGQHSIRTCIKRSRRCLAPMCLQAPSPTKPSLDSKCTAE